jgi:hypothetical protein
MVANGHTRKDCCRTAHPHVHTKANRSDPGWTRRLQCVMVGVENGRQVPDQAIVTDLDAMKSHDRGASVNEDLFAEHKTPILGCADFDRYCFAAQAQTFACDYPAGDEHWLSSIYRHDGGPCASPSEYGRSPEAQRHVANFKHCSYPAAKN